MAVAVLPPHPNRHRFVTYPSEYRNFIPLPWACTPNSSLHIMHTKKQTLIRRAAMAAGVAASTFCGVQAQAQSADALLDKLVDKGILTTKEANELRQEANAGFRKAYQVK